MSSTPTAKGENDKLSSSTQSDPTPPTRPPDNPVTVDAINIDHESAKTLLQQHDESFAVIGSRETAFDKLSVQQLLEKARQQRAATIAGAPAPLESDTNHHTHDNDTVQPLPPSAGDSRAGGQDQRSPTATSTTLAMPALQFQSSDVTQNSGNSESDGRPTSNSNVVQGSAGKSEGDSESDDDDSRKDNQPDDGDLPIDLDKQVSTADLFSMTIPRRNRGRYGPNACNFLRLNNPLRKLCIRLISYPAFDVVIFIIILLNCVAMAISTSQNSFGWYQPYSNPVEYVFMGIFVTEILIKLCAMGIYYNGKRSYFRDAWNHLDFWSTAIAFLSIIPGVGNFSLFRAFRIARAFRTIRSVPGMRILMTALLSALPSLVDVFMLVVFFCLILGLIGMQLFSGKLLYRCFNPITNAFDEDALCAPGKQLCEVGHMCLKFGSNPDSGLTSYDNILFSATSIIISISKEGWSDIMYNYANLSSYGAVVYFLIVMVFGSMFLMNLVTAVVYIRFEHAKEKEYEKRREMLIEVLAQRKIDERNQSRVVSVTALRVDPGSDATDVGGTQATAPTVVNPAGAGAGGATPSVRPRRISTSAHARPRTRSIAEAARGIRSDDNNTTGTIQPPHLALKASDSSNAMTHDPSPNQRNRSLSGSPHLGARRHSGAKPGTSIVSRFKPSSRQPRQSGGDQAEGSDTGDSDYEGSPLHRPRKGSSSPVPLPPPPRYPSLTHLYEHDSDDDSLDGEMASDSSDEHGSGLTHRRAPRSGTAVSTFGVVSSYLDSYFDPSTPQQPSYYGDLWEILQRPRGFVNPLAETHDYINESTRGTIHALSRDSLSLSSVHIAEDGGSVPTDGDIERTPEAGQLDGPLPPPPPLPDAAPQHPSSPSIQSNRRRGSRNATYSAKDDNDDEQRVHVTPGRKVGFDDDIEVAEIGRNHLTPNVTSPRSPQQSSPMPSSNKPKADNSGAQSTPDNSSATADGQPPRKKKPKEQKSVVPKLARAESSTSFSASNSSSYSQSSRHSGTEFWKNYYQAYDAEKELDNRTTEEKRLDFLMNFEVEVYDPEKHSSFFSLRVKQIYYRHIVWPLFYAVSHPYFINLVNFFVLANAIFLMFDHYSISSGWLDANLIANNIFTAIFVMEFLLKFIAYGPSFYFGDAFNRFDFFIILMSITDIILYFTYRGTLYRVFVSLRILRLFKIIRSYQYLQRILFALQESLSELAYFGILVCLFIFVFSILGVQFFKYRIICDDMDTGASTSCPTNFDNFGWAIIAIFQHMTAENWNDTLVTSVDYTSYAAALYFILLLFLGNYVLLAIFISILLSNVDHSDPEEELEAIYEQIDDLAQVNDEMASKDVNPYDRRQRSVSYAISVSRQIDHVEAITTRKFRQEGEDDDDDSIGDGLTYTPTHSISRGSARRNSESIEVQPLTYPQLQLALSGDQGDEEDQDQTLSTPPSENVDLSGARPTRPVVIDFKSSLEHRRMRAMSVSKAANDGMARLVQKRKKLYDALQTAEKHLTNKNYVEFEIAREQVEDLAVKTFILKVKLRKQFPMLFTDNTAASPAQGAPGATSTTTTTTSTQAGQIVDLEDLVIHGQLKGIGLSTLEESQVWSQTNLRERVEQDLEGGPDGLQALEEGDSMDIDGDSDDDDNDQHGLRPFHDHERRSDAIMLPMTVSYFPQHIPDARRKRKEVPKPSEETDNNHGCCARLKEFFVDLWTSGDHLVHGVFKSKKVQQHVDELKKQYIQQELQRLAAEEHGITSNIAGEAVFSDDDDDDDGDGATAGHDERQDKTTSLDAMPPLDKKSTRTPSEVPSALRLGRASSSTRNLSDADIIAAQFDYNQFVQLQANSDSQRNISRDFVRSKHTASHISLDRPPSVDPSQVGQFTSPPQSPGGSSGSVRISEGNNNATASPVLSTTGSQAPSYHRGHSIQPSSKTSGGGKSSKGSKPMDAESWFGGSANLAKLNPTKARKIDAKYRPVKLYGKSCFILPPDHPVRVFLCRMQMKWWYKVFLTAVILFSCVISALSTPNVDQDSQYDEFLDYSDIIVCSLFAIEAIIKLITQGVLLHKGSYFRSLWNIMEMAIILTFFIPLILIGDTDTSQSTMNILKALRALRPLRLVESYRPLRNVFYSIVSSAFALSKVFTVALLCFLVFSVIGVSLYKGSMQQCRAVYNSGDIQTLYRTNRDACELLVQAFNNVPDPDPLYIWQSPPGMNFDHVANAFLWLFQSSTFEMWPTFFHMLIDTTDDYRGPLRGASLAITIPFFIGFLMVGGFFVVSLITGVIVDEYQEKMAEYTESANLTDAQTEYLQVFKDIASTSPPMRMLPQRNPICCCTRPYNRREKIAGIIRTAANQINRNHGVVTPEHRSPAVNATVGTTGVMQPNQPSSPTPSQSTLMSSPSELELTPLAHNTAPSSGTDTAIAPPATGNGSATRGHGQAAPVVPLQLTADDIRCLDEAAEAIRKYSYTRKDKDAEQISALARSQPWDFLSPYKEVQFRNFIFTIVESKWFDRLVLLVIFINAIVLCLYWENQPKDLSNALTLIGDICTCFFVLEIVFKLVGLGPMQYLFSDSIPVGGDSKNWARFDVFVVIVSVIPFFARRITGNDNARVFGMDPSIFRIFRIFRLVRLSRRLDGMKSVIGTMIYSVTSLASVGFVLLLVFFFYSIIGMSLFSNVRYGPYINENTNFSTFPRAILTLFVASTGENWPGMLSDLMVDAPLCDPNGIVDNCGYPVGAPIFFVTFVLLTEFLMTNIFIAVVVSNYEAEVQKLLHETTSLVTTRDISEFMKAWGNWRLSQIYYMWNNKDKMSLIDDINAVVKDDPDIPPQLAPRLIASLYGSLTYQGTIDYDCKSVIELEYPTLTSRFTQEDSILSLEPTFMHVSQLALFLNNLRPPLGFLDAPLTNAELMRLLIALNIRQHRGYVHCAEVALALVQTIYGSDILNISSFNEQYISNKNLLKAQFPQLRKLKSCKINAGYYMCLIRAQRAAKRFVYTKRAERLGLLAPTNENNSNKIGRHDDGDDDANGSGGGGSSAPHSTALSSQPPEHISTKKANSLPLHSVQGDTTVTPQISLGGGVRGVDATGQEGSSSVAMQRPRSLGPEVQTSPQSSTPTTTTTTLSPPSIPPDVNSSPTNNEPSND